MSALFFLKIMHCMIAYEGAGNMHNFLKIMHIILALSGG